MNLTPPGLSRTKKISVGGIPPGLTEGSIIVYVNIYLSLCLSFNLMQTRHGWKIWV